MERTLDGVALFLEHHPIRRTLFSYFKLDYLSALDFLLRKYGYGESDPKPNAMFNVYVDVLAPSYSYCGAERAVDVLRTIMGSRFDFVIASRYRYCFMMDCLTMLAYSDMGKAKKIFEDLCQFAPERSRSPLHTLFNYLYLQGNNDKPPVSNIKYQLKCLEKTRAFVKRPQRRILVTATMSAGKSTLINALVGKQVSRTQNEACTGKIHYIHDKPYEDGFTCKWESTLDMNATGDNLLSYDDSGEPVDVWTHFRAFLSDKFRWCFIDTPGVNSSLNMEHANLAHKAIKEEQYDRLIYVINGEHYGTNDDKEHLEYVAQHVPSSKVVFVFNKLDNYDVEDDSIPESVSNVREYLEKAGFKSPVVCPMSAYAAWLAKKYLFGEVMKPQENGKLQIMLSQFQMEDYDLSRFALDLTEEDKTLRSPTARNEKLSLDCYELLSNCGFLWLEKALGDNNQLRNLADTVNTNEKRIASMTRIKVKDLKEAVRQYKRSQH